MPKLPVLEREGRVKGDISTAKHAESVARTLRHSARSNDNARFATVVRQYILSDPQVRKHFLEWFKKQ